MIKSSEQHDFSSSLPSRMKSSTTEAFFSNHTSSSQENMGIRALTGTRHVVPTGMKTSLSLCLCHTLLCPHPHPAHIHPLYSLCLSVPPPPPPHPTPKEKDPSRSKSLFSHVLSRSTNATLLSCVRVNK